MRLAVLPGVVGDEEIDELLGHLADGERITVAAGGFVPGAADRLADTAKGSRALKIPRDILTRTLRHPEPHPAPPRTATRGDPDANLTTAP